jgi:Holliday junction resolvase
MPPRRPKDKGTDAERAVVRYLQANGFPQAERRASNGNADRGDITGVPGICWEVKYRDKMPGDGQINLWLIETDVERRNARADVGVLVVRRPRAAVDAWWTVVPLWVVTYLQLMADRDEQGMPGFTGGADLYEIGSSDPTTSWMQTPIRILLRDAVTLLRAAGYGEPLPDVTAMAEALEWLGLRPTVRARRRR